jgi:hypothetical protein
MSSLRKLLLVIAFAGLAESVWAADQLTPPSDGMLLLCGFVIGVFIARRRLNPGG